MVGIILCVPDFFQFFLGLLDRFVDLLLKVRAVKGNNDLGVIKFDDFRRYLFFKEPAAAAMIVTS